MYRSHRGARNYVAAFLYYLMGAGREVDGLRNCFGPCTTASSSIGTCSASTAVAYRLVAVVVRCRGVYCNAIGACRPGRPGRPGRTELGFGLVSALANLVNIILRLSHVVYCFSLLALYALQEYGSGGPGLTCSTHVKDTLPIKFHVSSPSRHLLGCGRDWPR